MYTLDVSVLPMHVLTVSVFARLYVEWVFDRTCIHIESVSVFAHVHIDCVCVAVQPGVGHVQPHLRRLPHSQGEHARGCRHGFQDCHAGVCILV